MTAPSPSPSDTLRLMTNGFRVSQLIHVTASLGIADHLRDGPRSAGELARATAAHPPTLYRLLRALAALGLVVEDEGGRFGLTELGDSLRADAPSSVRAYAVLIGQPEFWATWGQLLQTVKTGKAAFPEIHAMSLWEYCAQRPDLSALFNQAMTANSRLRTEAITSSYDFSTLRTLVDVGGGEGALMAAILVANPTMRGVLYEQPQVVTGARDLLLAAGVADRCQFIGGNFFESVPAGADGYVLKSIIHDWEDDEAIRILENCRAGMTTKSRILVVERLIPAGADPAAASFGDIFMLTIVGGRERTAEEFAALFAQAGLRLTNVIPTPSEFSLLEGTRA